MHGLGEGLMSERGDIAVVANKAGGGVVKYDPTEARRTIKQAEHTIALAADLHDWALVEAAIDAKLDAWTDFVAWWRANVSVRQSPGGADRSSNADRRSMLSKDDAESATGISQQQVSRAAKRLAKRDEWREAAVAAARKKVLDANTAESGVENHRAQGTGENEWYTPAEHIERARAVLGEFDLDPASSPIAQKIVKARQFFTINDDGLKHEWRGRVWLNPPYAQPAIQHFAEKIVSEVRAKRVTEAIMLTHNYTDTAWFHHANSAASAICFTRGRIGFLSPSGERAAPTQGQAFFYYGGDVAKFARAFSDIGMVVVPA